MLDIGWSEMAVVAVIALIIIGPRDLPRILRVGGQWAGKARKIAREFQNSLDDMVRESEIDEVKKGVETATNYDVKKGVENAIDPTGALTPNIDPTASDGNDELAPSTDSGKTPGEAPSSDSATEDAAASAKSQASG